MTIDDDIRAALGAEADRYDPADDGWERITAGVGAVRRRRRAVGRGLAGVAALAVVLAIGLGGLTRGGDGIDVDASREPDVVATDPTPPPTDGPGTTAGDPPGPAIPEGVFPGIWPFPSRAAIAGYADGDAALEDPVLTAGAFGRDYLGMADPAVGPAREAGGPDGDVLVDLSPRGEDGTPLPTGTAVTTVRLRSYATTSGDPVWTVVEARSPNIVLDAPVAPAEVASPLEVRGAATGYEGTVVAEVREDGMRAGEALGKAVGIAGSLGELGPLALDVPFDPPGAGTGALVVTTDSGLDGGPFEATVVRLAFAAPGTAGPAPTTSTTTTTTGSTAPTGPCPPPVPTGAPGAGEMEVTVHLVCAEAAGADPEAAATWVEVRRRVPRTTGVLRASLAALLSPVTPAEAAAGLSGFVEEALPAPDVTLSEGTAVVDLDASLVELAPGGSSATGGALLREALARTTFQFATVERVEYRLGGSCEAFWAWQQVGGCRVVDRPAG